MVTAIVVLAATALTIITLAVHRERGARSKLLRRSVAALFMAAAFRELSDGGYLVALTDPAKRLALLLSEVNVVLLVLTFRSRGVSARAVKAIWSTTAVLGLAQVVLACLLVAQSGTVAEATSASDTPVEIAYHLLFDLCIVAATTVVGIGCFQAMCNRRQLPVARVSLGLVVAGSVSNIVYAALGLIGLATAARDDFETARSMLFVLSMALFLLGIGVGGLRQVVINHRERKAVNEAIDAIEPLWRVATAIQPDVVLRHRSGSRRERLIRLVVETHDALRIMRAENAERLSGVFTRFDRDPLQAAAMLLQLLGGEWVPQKTTPQQRLVLGDESLARSLYDLQQISRACQERGSWWTPVSMG